ncbi:MAG: iron-containing alcohol dehydrogenase [Clostridiales bacterium]|nr:iron-containing alcohol dehydrogenase [Clostridiales bacterium]
MNKKAYEIYCRTYQAVMRAAVNVLDWSEPKLIKGEGSVRELPKVVKELGYTNVLVVTDKGLMGLHLLDGLFEELKNNEIAYVVYDGVQPNPTIDNVEEARALYIGNGCQAIIAFGGGSPMDCAKICGARVARPDKQIPQMRGQLKVLKSIPMLFAVPTTAGTGSETTIAAVVSNPKTHEKNAINDPKLRPKYAVLDPALTVGLPPHITSTTGMDALTHAVEAYIGQSNTADTEEKAKMAVKMIFENLETAYKDGKNIEARENMLLASYYAGVAFTRAYVGYVHAIAHNLGGMYGIPHGLANAVILPYVLDYFGESAYKRLAELAEVAGLDCAGKSDEEKAKMFIAEIRRMNKDMNIPEKFEQIKEEDISTIADRALKEGNPLYPVPKIMDKDDCVKIIRELMA